MVRFLLRKNRKLENWLARQHFLVCNLDPDDVGSEFSSVLKDIQQRANYVAGISRIDELVDIESLELRLQFLKSKPNLEYLGLAELLETQA